MKLKIPIYIILILACCHISSFASQPNDWNIEHLRGKVKSIDEDTAVMKLKKGVLKEGSRNRTRSMIFDKDGRKTYEWFKIGILSPFETFYTYDKETRYNRGVRSNLPVSNRVYETLTKSVFNYKADENALYEEVVTENKGYPDTKIKGFKYVFDKDGLLIKETMYSANGEPVFLTIYIFGKENLPTDKLVGLVASDGKPSSEKYTYELDVEGNWTKRTAERTLANDAGMQPTEITYRKIEYYK